MTSTSLTESGTCGHCGLIHAGPCPRIKAVEYYPNGTMKRVEYHESKQVSGDFGGIRLPSRTSSTVSQCSGEANNCEQDEGA